jgi:hypothetical protein
VLLRLIKRRALTLKISTRFCIKETLALWKALGNSAKLRAVNLKVMKKRRIIQNDGIKNEDRKLL